ncbi:MAG: hypothetical protein WAO23_03820, partial [Dethiobacteria bacterium]
MKEDFKVRINVRFMCISHRKGVMDLFKLEKENNIDFLTQREGFRKNERQKDRGSWEEGYREETKAGKEQSGRPLYTDIPARAEEKVPNVREFEKIRLKIRYDYRGTARPGRV